jgi:hypothetical protein
MAVPVIGIAHDNRTLSPIIGSYGERTFRSMTSCRLVKRLQLVVRPARKVAFADLQKHLKEHDCWSRPTCFFGL